MRYRIALQHCVTALSYRIALYLANPQYPPPSPPQMQGAQRHPKLLPEQVHQPYSVRGLQGQEGPRDRLQDQLISPPRRGYKTRAGLRRTLTVFLVVLLSLLLPTPATSTTEPDPPLHTITVSIRGVPTTLTFPPSPSLYPSLSLDFAMTHNLVSGEGCEDEVCTARFIEGEMRRVSGFEGGRKEDVMEAMIEVSRGKGQHRREAWSNMSH